MSSICGEPGEIRSGQQLSGDEFFKKRGRDLILIDVRGQFSPFAFAELVRPDLVLANCLASYFSYSPNPAPHLTMPCQSRHLIQKPGQDIPGKRTFLYLAPGQKSTLSCRTSACMRLGSCPTVRLTPATGRSHFAGVERHNHQFRLGIRGSDSLRHSGRDVRDDGSQP